MECERCKLHVQYLERIITIQNEEIIYLKTLIPSKQNLKYKESKEISISVYDLIDYNVEELNVNKFLIQIEENYPALNSMNKLVEKLVKHDDYHLFHKEKSNIIKYLNKDNQIMYEHIDTFSSELCLYIFNKLKPIIENIFIENVDNDIELIKENNRVQNIMVLKDKKFSLNVINHILNV